MYEPDPRTEFAAPEDHRFLRRNIRYQGPGLELWRWRAGDLWEAVEDLPVEYVDPQTLAKHAKPHLWIHPEGMNWSDLTDTTLETLEKSMRGFQRNPSPDGLMHTLRVLQGLVAQMAYGVTDPAQSIVNMRDHLERMEAANTDWPLILSAEGEVMDGRHRLAKALVEGYPQIRVQRFVRTPTPSDVLQCESVEAYRKGIFVSASIDFRE